MTPGTYIRKRREAFGLSLIDLAIRLDTVPAVAAQVRAEWLAAIEADVAPISVGTGIVLSRAINFDPTILDMLMAIHAGDDIDAPRVCRECACSERDACVGQGKKTCWWVAEDLCCACLPPTSATGMSLPPAFIKPNPEIGAAA